ncbi:MAG: electron transfer flavoprotein subunit beta/FixA family protein [Candidatus Methylarchaceae archaeon HK01B]|nr:electron transfer flavoprotein subunit beta/FixA family protein [Candidatus Methylarchaceae archaeon HK01B]
MPSKSLKIIVCIKQVPAVPDMKIDPATNTLVREGVPCILNPWDKIGVEEGIRLREKYGGEVTVITMGPPQVKQAILECLAMGADRGVILSDRAFAGADTITTAYTLSVQIKKMRYDIIICGRWSMDAETGHVGPHLAELLGIPQICYVKKVDVDIDGTRVTAHREVEKGVEIIEAPLPVLLTVMKDLNEPRIPTLKGIIDSRRKEIRVINSSELGGDMKKYGLKGSPTCVKKVFPPTLRKPKMILQGDPKEVVENLVQILLREKII